MLRILPSAIQMGTNTAQSFTLMQRQSKSALRFRYSLFFEDQTENSRSCIVSAELC